MAHRVKESKSRAPINETHPMIRAAVAVLSLTGTKMSSRDIFTIGVDLGLIKTNQYNSLRARLSQHCDQPGAVVVLSSDSVRKHGSRTSWWVLAQAGAVSARSAS